LGLTVGFVDADVLTVARDHVGLVDGRRVGSRPAVDGVDRPVDAVQRVVAGT
jgi:hypothetical protein